MGAVTAERVVSIALGYVGYHEKASGSQLDSKTANSGSVNYTRFNKLLHELQPSNMDYPAPWCDAFVDACVLEAAGGDVEAAKRVLCGDFDDYTVASADLYKAAGRFDRKPQYGDQVFFKNSKGINHTGIVTKVTSTAVCTVEGNSGNEVKEHKYLKASVKIAGYGHPRYGTEANGAAAPATKPQGGTPAALAVDGKVGPATVKAWQRIMGTTADGVIGGQSSASKSCHSAINAIRYASDKHGSALVRAVQRELGCYPDGLLGPKTIKAVQKHLGVSADGHFGPATAKALQRRLNQGKF